MRKIGLFIVAFLLLCMGGSVSAQNKTGSDFTAVGAEGYVLTHTTNYSIATESHYGCWVKVTKMPSSGAPGTLTIKGVWSDYSSWAENAYISCYVKDASNREFIVTKIEPNAFASYNVQSRTKLIALVYYSQDIYANYVQTAKFEIGDGAFSGCEVLEDFCAYPFSTPAESFLECYRVGKEAFKNCTKLNNLRLRVTTGGSIGAEAFANCSGLSSIRISGSIDKTAFEGCTGINSILWYGGYKGTLNSSSDSPMYPMRGNVTSVTIYGAVPAHFFEDFTALKEVKSPAKFFESMKNTNIYQMGIGDCGFGYCKNLESIQVAGEIHKNAFSTCKSLKRITYRGGWLTDSQVPESYSDAFFYDVRANIESFTIEENSASNKQPNTFIPSYLCYGMSKLTSVTIPDYVLAIGEGAFQDCSGLKTVSISKSSSKLNIIGNAAFFGCSALTSITLPVSLVNLYDEAFDWCESMTTCPLTADNTNLRYIGRDVFRNTALTSLYIPKSVTRIGGMLTGGSKVKIAKITFMPTGLDRSNIGGSWAELFFGTADMYKKERKAVTEFRLNSERYYIPDSLFYNYEGLVQVVDETGSAQLNNVTEVGKASFMNCKAMWGEGYQTQLTNVRTVGESAFEGSGFKGSIDFKELATIGKRSFANTQLMYLHDMGTLPKLTAISEEAFASNAKLASATFNAVKTIGERAFANNSKLETISITNVVPTIQSNSFENCNVKTINTNCKVIDALKANADWNAVCSNIVNKENSYSYPAYMEDFWCQNATLEIVEELNCEGVFKVKAIPDEGYDFMYWNDGVTDNPRTVDLNVFDGDWLYAIAASADEFHRTNFTTTPEGAGYLEITNQFGHKRNNQKFLNGETAQLTPKEGNGWYKFDKWVYESVDGGEAPSPCDMEYNPNKLCVYISYMQDAGGGDMGGYEDPETGEWIMGEPVEPEIHAMFDENLKASFVLKAMPVTVEYCTDGNGTVDISGNPTLGQSVTITATPKEGYQFARWEDGNTDASRTFVITPELLTESRPSMMDPESGEFTYEEFPVDMGGGSIEPYHDESTYFFRLCAQFKSVTYTVRFVDWNGTVIKTEEVEYGKSATAPETPAREGFEFTGWDTEFGYVTGDLTVTAQYKEEDSQAGILDILRDDENAPCRKVVREGTVIIDCGEATFDMTGREVR